MKKITFNSIQYRIWLDSMLKPSSAYNIGCSFSIKGYLNTDLLTKALSVLMTEYEPLRSIVKEEGKIPCFEVCESFEVPLHIVSTKENITEQAILNKIDLYTRQEFDLKKEFPCRFLLLQKKCTFIFVLSFHHIVIDAQSIEEFCIRLSEIYNTLQNKKTAIAVQCPNLDEFNNFWTEHYTENDREKDSLFWQEYLKGADLHTTIPISWATCHSKNDKYFWQLGNKTYAKVESFCKENQTSPFRLYLAVWAITLSRYLSKKSLVLDYTVHLRPQKFKNLLGVFVNNLPMNIHVREEESFSSLLSLIKRDRNLAKKHQRAMYSDYLPTLRREQEYITETPFNIGINYPIHNHSLKFDFNDTESCFYHQTAMELPGDLYLVIEDDEALSCRIWHNEKISPAYAQLLAEAFSIILEQAIDQADILIKDIDLLAPQRKKELIQSSSLSHRAIAHWQQEGNAFSSVISEFQNIAKKHPDNISFVYASKEITYNELDKQSSAIAKYIHRRLQHNGIETSKQAIAISLSRRDLMYAGILGILKAGCYYIPIDAALPDNRKSFILQDSQAPLILTDQEGGKISDTCFHVNIEDVISISEELEFHPSTPHPDDIAYAIYTSGTTGMPKGIPITHVSLMIFLNHIRNLFEINESSIVLQYASIGFDVSIMEIFMTLTRGGTLIMPTDEERKDPDLLLALLERSRVNCCSIAPTMLSLLPHKELPCIKQIIAGGESTPKDVIEHWRKGRTFINIYGPTEVTIWATSCLMTDETPSNDIGTPFPGVSCYVLDEHMKMLPDGKEGELYMGGLQLTDGYINRPELNSEKFVANPYVSEEDLEKGINTRLYKSGDLVKRMPNGHLLFLGRIDFQVKIRGFRIELGEIETKLTTHPEVQQAVVVAAENKGRKVLVAYIQPTENNQAGAKELRDYLLEELPDYMIPAQIIPINNFPLNTNGKIDRKQLPSPTWTNNPQDNFVPYTTKTEEKIADIWIRLTGNQSIRRDDNFLSLGGDSISMIEMAALFEKELNVYIRINEIYANLTLSKLASHIDAKRTATLPSKNLPKADRMRKTPLALTQKSLWLQCAASQDIQDAYNVPCIIRFKREVSAKNIENAWNALLKNQESLRMYFPLHSNGEPYIDVHSFHTETLDIEYAENDELLKSEINKDFLRPYNLQEGPLYRIKLYKLTQQEHLLVLFMHHLITDGWSCEKIEEQLNHTIAQPEYQYIDYAYTQNQFLRSPEFKERNNFWNSYLKTCSDLRLPTKNKLDKRFDINGDSHILPLSEALSQSAIAFCERHSISPFSFFLSVFNMLLSRFSRQDDFVVGFPYAGRDISAFNNTIGYFVHTLPIRFQQRFTEMSFVEFAEEIHQQVRKLTEMSIPLNNILESIDNQAELRSDMPLVQTLFAFDKKQLFRDYLNPTQFTFELSVIIEKTEKGHQLRIDYMTRCFDMAFIDSFGKSYLSLLENILEHSLEKITSIPLLSKQETQIVIQQNTVSLSQIPSPELVIELFDAAVKQYPNNTALINADQKYTYTKLEDSSNRIAAKLKEITKTITYQGYLKNRPIGVFISNQAWMVPAIWGVLKNGNCYVPLDTNLPMERLCSIIKDCEITFVLSDEQVFFNPDTTIIPISQAITFNPEQAYFKPLIQPEDIAYVIYTSGTSGAPKGIPVSHASLVNFVINSKETLRLTPEDVFLQSANFSFDASIEEVFTPLVSGACVNITTLEERKNPSLILELIKRNKVSCLGVPPALLSIFPKVNLPHVRLILVGGENTPIDVINYWRQNRLFYNAYGPTENTVDTTCCLMEETTPVNDIGLPLSGVSCYILDQYSNLLPDGIPGELHIGGIQLTKGYINHPELNKEKFITNPYISAMDMEKGVNTSLYKSGDFVTRKPNGHLLFMGRIDSQVKIRGFRVELREIENQLLQYPDIQNALVVSQDFNSEKKLVAYLQSSNKQSIQIKELRKYLSTHLPSYMIPTAWSITDLFPFTPNGKIDIKRLPLPILTQEKVVEPSTVEEELMCNIIKNILKIDQVSVEADLFDLGLTSIQSMLCVFDAALIGIHISISNIYRLRSIRSILEEKVSPLYYWANEYKKEKPIVILICGYPYYKPFYDPFVEHFKDDYSFFVFESFLEYFSLQPHISLEQLLTSYSEVVKSVLKNKPIYAVTGFCLGSELAVFLANTLKKSGVASPKVLVMEGIYERIKNKSITILENKQIQEHFRISDTLVNTFPTLSYDGEMIICLVNKTSNKIALEFEEETDPDIIRDAHHFFYHNQEMWKQMYPYIPYYELDCNHWEFFEKKPLIQLRAIIKKHWSNETHP